MNIGIADFSDPTLLILGDASSLNWLADSIEARQVIDLATAPSVKLVNLGLVIAPTNGEGTLSRSNGTLRWTVSSTEAQKFADQLRVLAESATPAHAYLDPQANSAGVQIVASQGEYKDDSVFVR